MMELNKYDIKELNEAEAYSINGGGNLSRLIGSVLGAAIAVAVITIDGLGDEPVDSGTGLIVGQKY